MSEYVNVDYLKNRITTNFDEQDLYLPTHFRDVIDDALDMTKEFDGEVKPVKHGEWVFKQRNHDVDMVCGECGYVMHEAFAHGYTAEQVSEDLKGDTVWKTNYCPNCGCYMRGENEADSN